VSHLGARAAALVDGELGHEARDRALSHLASCASCRAEVVAQRALKQQLLGLVDPTPPSPLSLRLMSVPVNPPAENQWAENESTGRSRQVAVGVAASVVGGLIGGAFMLGGATDNGSDVRPPVERFNMQHTSTVGDVPFGVPQLGGFATVNYLRP
jgi:anti-sigma factor RsiW